MATQADALAKLVELKGIVVDLAGDVQAGFDALKAKITPAEDTQPLIDSIQATIDKLKSLDTAAETESGVPTNPV